MSRRPSNRVRDSYSGNLQLDGCFDPASTVAQLLSRFDHYCDPSFALVIQLVAIKATNIVSRFLAYDGVLHDPEFENSKLINNLAVQKCLVCFTPYDLVKRRQCDSQLTSDVGTTDFTSGHRVGGLEPNCIRSPNSPLDRGQAGYPRIEFKQTSCRRLCLRPNGRSVLKAQCSVAYRDRADCRNPLCQRRIIHGDSRGPDDSEQDCGTNHIPTTRLRESNESEKEAERHAACRSNHPDSELQPDNHSFVLASFHACVPLASIAEILS